MQQGAEPGQSISASVIVPTYNRAHYLPESLNSLLAQARRPDEIIIVDDGCTDDTAEVVGRYGNAVRYLRQPRNGGRPKAVNRGISEARGTHIWIFDDDDVALPDALQAHIAYLTAHPDIDFSYSTNYVFQGADGIWEQARWKPKHLPDWPTEEFFIHHAFAMHAMMPGMLIPKRCYDTLGTLDESLLRSQDDEFVLRLAHRFCGGNIGRPTFVLREHPGARGAGAARHAASKQATVWAEYGRRIYRQVHDQYPLSAFVPHRPGSDPALGTDAARALAYLQRAMIMLQHGLTAECLEDLRSAPVPTGPKSETPAALHHMVSAGFNVDASRLEHHYRFAWQVRRLLADPKLHALRRDAHHGTYWALCSALRQRRWLDALKSASVLALLLTPTRIQAWTRYGSETHALAQTCRIHGSSNFRENSK